MTDWITTHNGQPDYVETLTRLARDYPEQNNARTSVLLHFTDSALNPNQRAGIVRRQFIVFRVE